MSAFSNWDDFAMKLWLGNVWAFKPSFAYSHQSAYTGTPVYNAESDSYEGIQITDTFCQGVLNCTTLDWNAPDHQAKIIAHIIRARSKPLGGMDATLKIQEGGIIDAFVDLNAGAGIGYTANPYHHSAQFSSNNHLQQAYWERVLREFGLSEGGAVQ